MHILVLSSFILLFLPIIAADSFANFGGDMIEYDSFLFDSDKKFEETSGIVTINKIDNEEKLKRYIVFGHGSVNDLDSLTNSVSSSVSTSNGFFSIVTLPENKI